MDEFGHEPDIVAEQRAAAAIRGSTEALREVWQQHRRWVAGVLLAHKPRDVDLEDLLQDVALSLVRRIGDLRDPASVRPWLRQIAINAARASGRRQQVRTPERRGLRLSEGGADLGMPADAAGADPTGQGREEGARLLALARRLPEGYAEPLILRAVRGMSYREIGRVMDLPDTTIETRIARARRMVRELMAGEMVRQGGAAGRPPDSGPRTEARGVSEGSGEGKR